MNLIISNDKLNIALGNVSKGLGQYLLIQKEVFTNSKFVDNKDFRRRFNHFYRVRRSEEWREIFYKVMDDAFKYNLGFNDILISLNKSTGRYEASFASKLYATINPDYPVIDSIVLKNLELKLPPTNANNRAEEICALYTKITDFYSDLIVSETGLRIIEGFNRQFSEADISSVKKIDLVLWQLRSYS